MSESILLITGGDEFRQYLLESVPVTHRHDLTPSKQSEILSLAML